jgi:hypothetical protein
VAAGQRLPGWNTSRYGKALAALKAARRRRDARPHKALRIADGLAAAEKVDPCAAAAESGRSTSLQSCQTCPTRP